MNGETRSDILWAGGVAILMVVMSAWIMFNDTDATLMWVLIIVGTIEIRWRCGLAVEATAWARLTNQRVKLRIKLV